MHLIEESNKYFTYSREYRITRLPKLFSYSLFCQPMKSTIFISHAYPENNYFAAWLASKLKMLGYKVWVDLNDIKPGQYFNQHYENALRTDAARFLAIVSKDYLAKANASDSGVMNEITLARTIKDIDGFIIPLLYDDSDYSDFRAGLIGRLAISFNRNWANGLHELTKYLEEQGIPKSSTDTNVLKLWHEAQKIKAEPIKRPEKYFTNWFTAYLPEYIFCHQIEALLEKDFSAMPFTYIREKDILISFTSDSSFANYTSIRSSLKFKTEEFLSENAIRLQDEFDLVEPRKKLVKLMNKLLRAHFFKRGMRKYDQSSKKEIFYFPYKPENTKMINLKALGRSRRSIIGKTSEFTWYFAISHSAILSPVPCFKIFYHLVFTDNHGNPLNIEDQHELRRTMPSDWFNRKWLETLLAMMFKVSNFDSDKEIKIFVDERTLFTVDVLPLVVFSNTGYNEPNSELED